MFDKVSEKELTVEKIIVELNKFIEALDDEQIKTCQKQLHEYIFPDGDAEMRIPEALPLIVESLKSENHLLRQIGSLFAAAIILNSDDTKKQKENIGILIEAQVLPIFVNLLSSPNYEVVEKSLCCLNMISFHFPKQIVICKCLPLVSTLLKSKHDRICWGAAQLIMNITNERVQQNIAGCIGSLVELLDSKDADVQEAAIAALVNIVFHESKWCKIVLDNGILDRLKKLFNQENQEINFYATLFIRNITKHGNVDIAVNEGFIDLILDQISNGSTSEIKIESINVIHNIFEVKELFASTAVDAHQLVPVLLKMDEPLNRDMDFVKTALSALTNIFQLCEEKLCEENLVRRKIFECDGLRKIENLPDNILQNKKIQELRKKIMKFCAVKSDDEEYSPKTLNRSNSSVITNTNSVRRSKRIKKSVLSLKPVNSSQSGNLADNNIDIPSVSQSHVSSNSAAANDLLQNEEIIKSDVVDEELYNDFDEPSELQLPVNPNNADTPSNQIDTVLSRNPALDVPSTSRVSSEISATNSSIPVTRPRRKRSLINQVQVNGNKRIKVEIEETNDHAVDGEMQNNLNEPSQRQMSVNSVIVAVDTSVKNEVEDYSTPVNDNVKLKRELSELDNLDDLSRASASFEHFIPEGMTENDIKDYSIKNSDSSVIEILYPSPMMNDAPRNEESFFSFKYQNSSESYIENICNKLGLEYSSTICQKFLSQMELNEIASNSKPDLLLPSNEKTGFGWISLLLTGNEGSIGSIKDEVNKYFYNKNCHALDPETIGETIFSKTITPAHFDAITQWFKCRILVYSNGIWERYGEWGNNEDPIFVLDKKETQNGSYHNVLRVKKD